MSDDKTNGRIAGLDLGAPIEGEDAKRRRWHEWVIALVAGRTVIGRLRTRPFQALPDSTTIRASRRSLAPVYDFISGFNQTPQGLQEIHKAFPFMALEVKEIELPDGAITIPFSDLTGMELDGMARQVEEAEELLKQMRIARSGLVIANAMPVLPKVPG